MLEAGAKAPWKRSATCRRFSAEMPSYKVSPKVMQFLEQFLKSEEYRIVKEAQQ